MTNPPARYGIISLVAAVLAWATWPLLTVVGPLVGVVQVPLALLALITGLIGVGTGIRHGCAAEFMTGAAGLCLIACGACLAVHSIMHF
jgi:hypothetical protein